MIKCYRQSLGVRADLHYRAPSFRGGAFPYQGNRPRRCRGQVRHDLYIPFVVIAVQARGPVAFRVKVARGATPVPQKAVRIGLPGILVMIMNLRLTMYKLQTALCRQGRYIRINQFQSYSEKAERMVTKYVLSEKRNINGEEKTVTLLETYQQVDVIRTLAELRGGD